MVVMAGPASTRESLIMNWTAKGAILLGALGAVIGLIVGIVDDRGWRVAWFATMELGVPSFIVGGAFGALCGATALGIRRVRNP
jgi:hypothetical protein